jgi:DNA-binding transcriptional MerR regulator
MAGNGLTPKQEAAIMALLSEPTLEAAAKRARVSVRTLRRWKNSDAFREGLRVGQRRVFDLAIARAQNIADEAVATLEAIHKDTSQPATARVAAARALDSRRWKAHDAGDLEARLEELERAAKRAREGAGL